MSKGFVLNARENHIEPINNLYIIHNFMINNVIPEFRLNENNSYRSIIGCAKASVLGTGVTFNQILKFIF